MQCLKLRQTDRQTGQQVVPTITCALVVVEAVAGGTQAHEAAVGVVALVLAAVRQLTLIYVWEKSGKGDNNFKILHY